MVEERLNVKMEIMLGDKVLPYRKIEVRLEKPKVAPRLRIRKPVIPPANHPWKTSESKRMDLRKQRKQPVPWALL